jgi:hypothetical protein
MQVISDCDAEYNESFLITSIVKKIFGRQFIQFYIY